MIALPFVGIDVLLIVLWTIAAALAIALIMNKLAAILNGVPWVGGKLSDAVKSMAQAITSACGQLMSGTESVVGGGLHWIARHIETWLNQFVAHATVIAHLAQIVGNEIYSVSGLRALVHNLTRAWHGIEHGIRTLTREYHGLEHDVRALERELAKGIGNDVLPRIRTLEKEVAHVKNVAIPDIRGIANTAETEVTDLEKWIAKNLPAIGTTAFVGAIAAALSSIGLGWLRCSSNPFNNNKNACGLWSILGRVLGLAAFLTIAFDFQEFVAAADEVAGFIGEAVAGIEGTFATSLPPLPPPN